MKKNDLERLSNDELFNKLDKLDYCDKDLLKEYDKRKYNGRFKRGTPMLPDDLEEFFYQKRKFREKKKAS